MSKRIEVPIALETTGIRKGADDAERALADLEDAVADTGKDGARDLDRLEDALKDVQRQSERTENSVEDIGDAGDKGFRRIGDTGAEVSDELRGNIGETFSSFRGDLEDLPQIAQDTLGGLAGSGALGGLPGLFAAAAGAAGLGLLIGALDVAGEKQERLKELAQEWADAYIEEGSRVLSFEAQVQKVRDVMANSFDEANANAETWGVSLDTAVAAMAGSESAIREVEDAVRALDEEFLTASMGTGQYTDNMGNVDLNLMNMSNRAADARGKLNDITGAMQSGAEQADLYSRLLVDMAESTAGATERVDEFGDRIIALPDGQEVYIDAETGRATMNVDAIEKKVYGFTDKPHKTTVEVEVDDRAVRNWKPPRKVMTIGMQVTGDGALLP